MANNTLRIPTSLDGKFFGYWFEILRPFTKLTKKESEVITALAKKRYELSKVIKDPVLVDKVLMSDDTKRQIRQECKDNEGKEMSVPHFQVIMGKLKKNKLIVDGKLDPRFLPSITEEKGTFQLLFAFELQ